MIIVEGNYKISEPAHRPSFPAPRVHVPPPLSPLGGSGGPQTSSNLMTLLYYLTDIRALISLPPVLCLQVPTLLSVLLASSNYPFHCFLFFFYLFLFFILFSLVDLELNHCRFRFLWLLFPRASSPFIARVAVRVYLIYCDRNLCLFVVYLTVCFLSQFAFALLASSLDFPVTVG